ncbi:MAG TPA: DUF5686 and carboxypeptidase regulatory-like domain-containing protein [Bacteroidia bacterium]|nr:DUF5686 and carboxypeptidase regulatory-like domain-containing protein [Bacteroidia bacterium]
MLKILSLFLLVCSFTSVLAQSYILSGTISGNTEALPFASVFLKGSGRGASSNDAGKYSLKLEKGTYTIIFQYVGYSKQEVTVDLSENKTLDISLKSDGIALQEVVVGTGEGPAYPIMRKAIKKRKLYANPVEQYSCQSYIKGLERLNYIPEKLKKLIKFTSGENIDSTQLGVIYLSESESNYYFKKPKKEKEVMFSSRVSGEAKSFSFNQLSQLKFNFYNNLISFGGISDRPFVSPLNSNAFLYYKYRLIGTILEDGKLFNKIEVKPKRKTDPCFTGVIYIQENTWRLTSLDLRLTKENKIKFMDTLVIKQLFAPVLADSIWMPVNYNMSFSFGFMGIAANGYFNAVVKNYNLAPDLKQTFFNNEIMVIENGANKKDSGYWNNARPAPLSREEVVDYRKKDSSEKIQNTDRYKDSVDKKGNRFHIRDAFFGYNYNKTKKGLRVSVPGIVTNGVQYNTVEGLNLSYNFSVVKEFEDFRSHRFNGKARYGFSNYLWGGEAGYNYFYKPEKFSRIGIKIKSIVEQYNSLEPIAPLINSAYSLLMNENYMKLYKETAAEGSYSTELLNGVYFNSSIKYARRDPLKNSSDILFIDDKSKLFTSNDPLLPANNDLSFKTSQAFVAEVLFTFRFRQKYVTVPHRKIITRSKYPHFSIAYKKAIPVLSAGTSYDLASASVYDDVSCGLFGRLGYRIKGGGFLNSAKMDFMDYKHFSGNQTIVNTGDYLNSYRLLPYYTYSANEWFVEAHAEHHFNGFIMNKIPLLKKLKVQEVVGVHLLMNNKIDKYYELNFGLENIFGILRVDYVLGYGINNQVKQGFTIGINTNL